MAFCALADCAAQGLGLFEGDPDRRFKAAYHGLAPEHEDVDALIGFTGGVQGLGDVACAMSGLPGADPGFDALLHEGDELVSDFPVDIGACV